jgi:hypothetical protein
MDEWLNILEELLDDYDDLYYQHHHPNPSGDGYGGFLQGGYGMGNDNGFLDGGGTGEGHTGYITSNFVGSGFSESLEISIRSKING